MNSSLPALLLWCLSCPDFTLSHSHTHTHTNRCSTVRTKYHIFKLYWVPQLFLWMISLIYCVYISVQRNTWLKQNQDNVIMIYVL